MDPLDIFKTPVLQTISQPKRAPVPKPRPRPRTLGLPSPLRIAPKPAPAPETRTPIKAKTPRKPLPLIKEKNEDVNLEKSVGCVYGALNNVLEALVNPECSKDARDFAMEFAIDTWDYVQVNISEVDLHPRRLEKIHNNIDAVLGATKKLTEQGELSQRMLNVLNTVMLDTVNIACDTNIALEPPEEDGE